MRELLERDFNNLRSDLRMLETKDFNEVRGEITNLEKKVRTVLCIYSWQSADTRDSLRLLSILDRLLCQFLLQRQAEDDFLKSLQLDIERVEKRMLQYGTSPW